MALDDQNCLVRSMALTPWLGGREFAAIASRCAGTFYSLAPASASTADTGMRHVLPILMAGICLVLIYLYTLGNGVPVRAEYSRGLTETRSRITSGLIRVVLGIFFVRSSVCPHRNISGSY
jgi:hypothetical protein